jgi:hypothetical protein
MEQPGIPTYILIAAIGVVILAGFLLFPLVTNYLRGSVSGADGRLAEPASNAPATQAPAGSMAERRQNIEELLLRKERES